MRKFAEEEEEKIPIPDFNKWTVYVVDRFEVQEWSN